MADIPEDRIESPSEVALLYSGGVDSTLAACVLARSFGKIHLNTFERPGFMAMDNPAEHAARLKARFPDREFIHRRIDAGRFYEAVDSPDPGLGRLGTGLMALNTCGHCKAALHWRNLIFCLQNGVKYAADGAVVGAEEFAEQNPRILMPALLELYASFGVTLLHPVYREGLNTEEALHEFGIIEDPRVKMTAKDKQVVCSQQVLFAMMMRVILSRKTFAEYEVQARDYLAAKLARASALTREYVEHPGERTRLSELLD